MSPRRALEPAAPTVLARVDAVFGAAGTRVREARLRRRWATARLAAEAGISREMVYRVERGEPAPMETLARLAAALGLRIEPTFEDPRSKGRPARAQDPAHAAIVEMLAGRYAAQSRIIAEDEPFQHYQLAGRADLVVMDRAGPDLLHHGVKTAIPNVGELAGAWNVKRQYLGPDTTQAFAAWWDGVRPPRPGIMSSVVLVDPIGRPRAAAWVGLEAARTVRPRHSGYAGLLEALRSDGRA